MQVPSLITNPLGLTDEQLFEFQMGIRRNPVLWAKILLDMELWRGPLGRDGQAELVESVFWHRHTVAPTGHGVGKTASIPIIIILWMLSHQSTVPGVPTFSQVALTAASWKSVERMIFPGLKAMVSRAAKQGLFFPRPTLSTWTLSDQEQVIGLSCDEPEPFQGHHSQHGTLVIADEASAVSYAIFKAMMSNLTGEEDHILLLGNPIHSDGPFVDKIRDAEQRGSSWHKIHISSLDSPNVRFGKDVIPGLASRTWIEEAKKDYGEGTPTYLARVEGLVPDQDEISWISHATVRDCGERKMIPWQEDHNLTLGVDVARSAVGDKTVLVVRGDLAVHQLEAHRGVSAPWIRARIKAIRDQFTVPRETVSRISERRVFVDGTGAGTGLCDDLIELDGFPPTIRVMNGASPTDVIAYVNVKAEQWGHMKEGLQTLAIPPEIVAQLSDLANLHYKFNTKDQLQIEPKADFKERNGRSPDEAEALALTYTSPVGDPAFPSACQCQKLLADPSIIRKEGKFLLHLKSHPHEFDRPGFLARAAWVSRLGESGAIWVHVDTDGCWSVYNALIARETPMRAFWQQVEERSKNQIYLTDVFSAWQTTEVNFESQDASALTDICLELKSKNFPSFIPPVDIDGSRGLAVIDHLLLSTLARFPDEAFWQRHNREDFLDDAQIYIWPQSVLDALIYARRRTDSWSKDAEETPTETLVGGGGPYVRCLRLLAVSG